MTDTDKLPEPAFRMEPKYKTWGEAFSSDQVAAWNTNARARYTVTLFTAEQLRAYGQQCRESALAAPQAEPVGWMLRCGEYAEFSPRHLSAAELSSGVWTQEPLYAAPPQAEPAEPEHWAKLRARGWTITDCKVCGESAGALAMPSDIMLTVGEFTLSRGRDGYIDIRRDGGEGGEFAVAGFARAVRLFYEEHF